ncbi:hypothetical protein [Clostridium sardiniense]|uniref:hypothetical protein n=1 Tax=Clostridium sardiniense TaxID=29369 RepID=UPI00195B1783|nr:hypothetical protein [Clostridium sardiniense]MBM7835569.1 hypothetical protein [Clostridium sardiniense]
MKKIIYILPFILGVSLFMIRGGVPDIVLVNGDVIEQGFGYSASGLIFFVMGIIMIMVKGWVILYHRLKKV